jgi:N-acetylglucosaminyldiphosphoundecaprenol N-acetyl-beta-D-mannosaminyltransferase
MSVPSDSRSPIAILGVRFDNVTIREALESIERMIATRRPHYAVTANVDFVVQAQNDVELRRIFFDAHLVLCDGTPLVWASRLLGNPLCERVAGADIVPLLLQLAEQRGYRVFFLGAAPDSIERAMANVRSRHPQLTICGYYSPPFNQLLEMDHDEIRRRVVGAQPDLLFVSLGCPKQEKWVAMNYRALGVPVTIGVGATIDFLAGQVRRAPVWMQRSGLEWVFRLLQEPRRLYRRYSKDIRVFGVRLAVQLWHLQRSRSIAGGTTCQTSTVVPPVIDAAAIRDATKCSHHWLKPEEDSFIDLSHVDFLDSTGTAALMKLGRDIALRGQHLILIAPSVAVKRILSFMRLEGFFVSAKDLAEARHIRETREKECEQRVALGSDDAFRALVWHGEITAANVDPVWERTRNYIEDAEVQSRSIVIDLSVVRFIDSSGLGLMVRVRKFARQCGLTLRFANLQPAVLNVVQIARLEEFLLDHKPQKFSFLRKAPARSSGNEPEAVLAGR